jgi:ATP-dependent Lon protease
MKFSNIILYLIGYPGVGKYSIAQEIQNQTGQFRLVDNHHVLNPFFL